MAAGARPHRCAAVLALSLRTLTRWREALARGHGDGRPGAVRPVPPSALSGEIRDAIVRVCNEPRFASMSPARIVPALADEGSYLASESTFYRVLRSAGQLHHRGLARAPRSTPEAPTHTAEAPNTVWAWDITWLPSTVLGHFFRLYVILDLYSRKIVAAEVWDTENAAHSCTILQRAYLSESILPMHPPLVLHGDNGSPLKAGSVLALMHVLGITPSHSRPRVSNDNPHAESLFRTLKYHPSLPAAGFATLEEARAWTHRFVQWYNHEHLHSSLRFVTPAQKHDGEDAAILARRAEVYRAAKARHPERWNGRSTRNWSPVRSTTLNPVSQRTLEPIAKRAA